jgi:hypothetical protein
MAELNEETYDAVEVTDAQRRDLEALASSLT